MKEPQTGLSRFSGLVSALLLIIGLPLSLLGFFLGRVVFNPPLLKNVLTEIVTESDFVPAALAWYSTVRAEERYASGAVEVWVDEPNVVDLIDFISINAWRLIRLEVFSDEILADWVSTTVDSTYAWIDSDERVPNVVWDLRKFRQRVSTYHGIQSISIAYQNLPDCTPEQLIDFKDRLEAAPTGTKVLYNLCKFPEPWVADQFSDYLESLQLLVDFIPASFNLTQQLTRGEDTQGVGPQAIKRQLKISRGLMRLAPVVPALLLVWILITRVRSLGDLGHWWGLPLAAGGGLAGLLVAVHRPLVTRLVSAGLLSEVPAFVHPEANQAVLRLAKEIFDPMLLASLLVFGLGILLVWMGKSTQNQAER